MSELLLPSKGWIIVPDSLDEDLWLIRRLKDTDEERIGEAVASYINFPQAMDIVVDRDQTFQTPIARRVNDLNSIGELDAKEEADSKSEEK